MNIEKVYHQIWFQGESKIPQKYEKYYKSCLKVNNDFQRIIWDSNKIDNLLKNHYPEYINFYESLPLMVQKIDYAKYIILYHYGGIYIDMDVKCLKNIKKLLNMFSDADFIVSLLPMNKVEISSINMMNKFSKKNKKLKIKNMINNGIIISRKRLDLLKQLIDGIKDNFYKKYNKNLRDLYIFNTTGPIIFTHIINKYQGNKNIKVIDSKYMEPCTILMKKCDFTKSFFHHEHQRTWGTSHLEKVIKILKFCNYHRLEIFILLCLLIYFLFFRNRT